MTKIDDMIEEIQLNSQPRIKIDELIKEVQQKYAEAAKLRYNTLKQAGDPNGYIKHHVERCKKYNKENHDKLKDYQKEYQKEYAPKYREQHPEQMRKYAIENYHKNSLEINRKKVIKRLQNGSHVSQRVLDKYGIDPNNL